MYQSINEVVDNWNGEKLSTLKIMRALTDASLKQQVEPGGRTLGRIAWHITTSIGEMGLRTGLRFDAPDAAAPVPESAAEIADAYEKSVDGLVAALTSQWTDATLQETREMYGEVWKNEFTLGAMFAHEFHHRGQMTVLMRQAGLRVPGVFGPAREEWAAMGMPEME